MIGADLAFMIYGSETRQEPFSLTIPDVTVEVETSNNIVLLHALARLQERLKSEFEGVKRTYVPMHAVIRIDEVNKQGTNKILAVSDSGSNVTPFPVPMYTPGGDSGSS